MRQIDTTTRVIAEGHLPPDGVSAQPGAIDAHAEITLFFAGRDARGPCVVTVPARRTRHVRFNDLVPTVVQHTRLDSRDPAVALMSTRVYLA